MTSVILAAILMLAPAQHADIPVPVLSAPTRDAPAPTPAEMATLRAGYALFDQKKFDEAIAKYEEVLSANPNSAAAMHEIAMAFLSKGDGAQALAMAVRSAAFRSDDLSKTYALIGGAFGEMGEPAKEIEVYDEGIALLPNAGTLYYNKAVTQLETLKDAPGALATLKRGAVADPRHAATQLMLSHLFLTDDLRTPGLLALSRFLILEPATSRTNDAFRLWYNVLNSNVQTTADGKTEMHVNPNKKKDEGDLIQLDVELALSQVTAAGLPADTSPAARLVLQLRTLLGVWARHDAGSDASTFLWTYYMPYFKELTAKTFADSFVYYVAQSVGMPGAREWLTAHKDQVDAFVAWDKAYSWGAGH